jgi:uncharacterized protein (DUF302 family)
MGDRIRFIKSKSAFSVQKTMDNVESAIQDRGIVVCARININRTQNAVDVGMRMNAAQVISFGNPATGTVRMQETVFLAHDLPLRARHLFTVVQGLCGAGT